MIKTSEIEEIRAEVILNYLYPESGSQWIVQNEGTFYRNYNSDLLRIDDARFEAETARDSFIKLLPQGLISLESDLKGEDRAERFKRQQRELRLLREAFKPIDSLRFRDSMMIEQQVGCLLQDKIGYVLSSYYGINLAEIENRYVREAALVLPYVSRKRGDLGFVAELLRAMVRCEVTMRSGRYSDSDSTQRWLPMVRYELIIEGLEPEQYRAMTEELKPLREFIAEWLMPVEVWCDILIKEHGSGRLSVSEKRATLGYNTEVISENDK